jgi:hypothetical protein
MANDPSYLQGVKQSRGLAEIASGPQNDAAFAMTVVGFRSLTKSVHGSQ